MKVQTAYSLRKRIGKLGKNSSQTGIFKAGIINIRLYLGIFGIHSDTDFNIPSAFQHIRIKLFVLRKAVENNMIGNGNYFLKITFLICRSVDVHLAVRHFLFAKLCLIQTAGGSSRQIF